MAGQSRSARLTANERLEVAALKAEFDSAAHSRSRSEMLRILTQGGVNEATWVVDMSIADPRRYGD